MHLRIFPLLAAVALSDPQFAQAQAAQALATPVQRYLRVSTPKVILEHVQVIDGTGAAPSPDQNVSIANGKISAISPGADEAARPASVEVMAT